MTIGESYDPAPRTTVREIAQVTERLALVEARLAALEAYARSQKYSDKDECADIGSVGLAG